jgi:hypothetical protein
LGHEYRETLRELRRSNVSNPCEDTVVFAGGGESALLVGVPMHSPALRSPCSPLPSPVRGEIDGANVRIYYASRSLAFLFFVLVATLVAAVALGRHFGKVSPSGAEGESPVVLRLLTEPRPDFRSTIAALWQAPSIPAAELDPVLKRSEFSAGTQSVIAEFAGSLREGMNEPTAQLLILAHQMSPEPGANECVAELLMKRGELGRAEEYLKRELAIAPNNRAREKLIGVLARAGDYNALASLSKDPDYAPVFPHRLQMKVAFSQHDWVMAAKHFILMQGVTMQVLPVVMASAAGLAWLLIALHAGQPRGIFSFRTIAPLAAAALGMVAGVVGQFLTVAQKEMLGMGESGIILADLGFYAGVIVPRDMALKLVFILPFLPFLLSRKSALDTLVVTGCVGLGFAIPGNLDLCKYSEPGDLMGRLLTANFFHFAATALVGYAGYRCLLREPGSLRAGIVMVPAVIIAMGVYETFTRIPGASVPMVIATIAFLILSRVFFTELHKWRDSFTDQCFLGATLVVSLAALVGTMLVAASVQAGFDPASWALMRNLPNLLLVGLVFFAQFKRGFAPIGSELTTPAQT